MTTPRPMSSLGKQKRRRRRGGAWSLPTLLVGIASTSTLPTIASAWLLPAVLPSHHRTTTTTTTTTTKFQRIPHRINHLPLNSMQSSTSETLWMSTVTKENRRKPTPYVPQEPPTPTRPAAATMGGIHIQQKDLPGPIFGVIFSSIVVILLAATDFSVSESALSDISYNIIDAALPLTVVDAVSVALGEGVAGIIGAVVSVSFSVLFQKAMKKQSNDSMDDEDSMSSPASAQVVADSEFFITRAGALPLVSALGLSGTVAALSSAIIAFVPYQITMAVSEKRFSRKKEDQIMQALLDEETLYARKTKHIFDPSRYIALPKEPPVVDVNLLKPATQIHDTLPVEVFADIVKWLGYSVLSSDFSGRFAIDDAPLIAFPGAEGAAFGVILGFSSQIYTDVLYLSGWGGESRQRKVLTRTVKDWMLLCFARSASAAILFGMYEASQIPAKALVTQLLSGGMDGCAGSKDYNLCIEA